MMHTDPGYPLSIGEGCTIGHRAILHGCTIGDNSLIGMGAIMLNGAQIGSNCLVGAGALVTEGKVFPDNSLIVGAPAKAIRVLDEAAAQRLKGSADHYVDNARRFRAGLEKSAKRSAEKRRSRPGGRGPAPRARSLGTGRWGVDRVFPCSSQRRLATASSRPSLICTQMPELNSDWRLRKV